MQATTTAAIRQAQELTPAQLAAHPHLRCRVEAPRCYEGHLCKLLCSMLDVQGSLSPGEGQTHGAGATTAADSGSGGAAASAGCQDGQGHDRGHGSGASSGLCSEAQEAQALAEAQRVFVFMHRDLEETAGLRLDAGESFVLLRPWDVLKLPGAPFPLVMAYVGAPVQRATAYG